MEIVITHLTRMAKGFCCATGIEPSTGKVVRAVQRPYAGTDPRLSTDFLWLSGGPFKTGNVVDLGKTVPNETPPETEDHYFNPANARLVSVYSPIQFWSLLLSQAKARLSNIFGIEPVKRKASLFIPAHQGTNSLGFYQLRIFKSLSISQGIGEQKIRFVGKIEEHWVNLSVTDIRLFADDCVTPDYEKVQFVAARLSKEARLGRVILGLGLTRPFAEAIDANPVHWIQATGIHLR